jgi:Ca-activated chloride channel homolog
LSARWLLLAAVLASGTLAEAERAYRRGDFAAAAAGYARALAAGDSSAVVRYNLGTSLLRLGRHDEARAQLEAAARAPDAPLRSRAAYNAGWADLAPVAAGRAPAPERTARLERAVAHYRAALRAAPDDADAKWNLELAERLLRTPPEAPGGGGGGEDGGGEGGTDDAPAGPRPALPGDERALTPAETERLLAGAEQRDLRVQREQLRRAPRQPPALRDW